ncbi:MAG TPA: HAD-IC family P-type ATPase [Opitutaceae bacterium]|nr:HAD-IC family P-type ATPase [Opitutaceae bacterium]
MKPTSHVGGTAVCKHCGTAFTPTGGHDEFCSPGCAAVHAQIVRDGLDRFYELKDRAVSPASSAVFQPRDYGWLAEAIAAAEQEPSGEPKETAELVLDVQGISCVGCVWLIERLFRRCAGAVRIEINATQGRLFWRWEPGRFDAVAFARELQAFGYLVGPAGEKPGADVAQGLRLRLGLAAAFAMNTMIFALPAYLGLERTSEFYPLFEGLQAAFATAGLLTGGSFFAKRAWGALRHGFINLDVPITLGLAIGYAGSLYGWLGAHEHLVYFDFVAVFSFLMLVGRWTQETAIERNRLQLLSLTRDPAEVLVEEAGTVVRRAVSTLRRGMVFRLRAGQVVPVAARLLDGAATVTTEWINGEPEPREVAAGQTVPAGATSVSLHELRLEAGEPWSDSALARLLATSGAQGFRHERAERIVRGYLAVILLLALCGGAAWWWIGGDGLKALHVTVALLVASCPCGIGVAFPLVEELAVAAMRRHGVFVRELSLFPRLRGVRKAIFDKTGTLTLETPVLANPEVLGSLEPQERRRLWQLVRDNPHPTARALQEALAWTPDHCGMRNPESESAAAVIEEVVGQGVRLRAEDGEWALGRPEFANPRSAIRSPQSSEACFAHDGRGLASFRFEESARSDARAEIAALQREGREVFILSGDRPEKVSTLAAALGVPAENALGGLTPEEKRDWVLTHEARDTLMLGDGANDSLAFDAAFARGTPVIHRGMLERKCDFYYLGRGLRGVRRLFAVAELRRRALRRVFVFAVCYNAGTVSLALAGHINPLVAAVAMPVSSLISLALATVGMRRAWRTE